MYSVLQTAISYIAQLNVFWDYGKVMVAAGRKVNLNVNLMTYILA